MKQYNNITEFRESFSDIAEVKKQKMYLNGKTAYKVSSKNNNNAFITTLDDLLHNGGELIMRNL